MSVLSQIESILFVASKPLALAVMAASLGKKEREVEEAVAELKRRYNTDQSGLHILQEGKLVQMATNASNAAAVEGFIKDEVSGELTKAQLETVTVIAYRGPITRPELEQIRGVNCALILRNLLVRGLIDEQTDKSKLTPVYTLSFAALRELGVRSVTELPDYNSLHAHEHIERALGEVSL